MNLLIPCSLGLDYGHAHVVEVKAGRPEIFYNLTYRKPLFLIKAVDELRSSHLDLFDLTTIFNFLNSVFGYLAAQATTLLIGVDQVPGNARQFFFREKINSAGAYYFTVFLYDKVVLGIFLQVL